MQNSNENLHKQEVKNEGSYHSKDSVGILAKVSEACSKADVNIVEVTQSVLQDMFAMIMLVEIDKSNIGFEQLRTNLKAVGESTNTKVHVMHEDIFNSMHRI